MSHKRNLHRHLLVIYILFFVVLILGFFSNVLPGAVRSWQKTGVELNTKNRFYYVSAHVGNADKTPLALDGLPANVNLQDARLNLRVNLDEPMTEQNSWRVMADNRLCFWLPLVTLVAFVAVLILLALIINSLRKSVRYERPLWHGNILRTRIIGALVIVVALCEAWNRYIFQTEAARVLAGTNFEVSHAFSLNYMNVIMGVVFIFMAEVIALAVRLGEEQKLTI